MIPQPEVPMEPSAAQRRARRITAQMALICLLCMAGSGAVLLWVLGARALWPLLGANAIVISYSLWWTRGHLDALCDPDSGELREDLGLPNIVSSLRLLLVPPLGLAIAMLPESAGLAGRTSLLGVLVALFLTDVLDGLLARRLDQRTRFGMY